MAHVENVDGNVLHPATGDPGDQVEDVNSIKGNIDPKTVEDVLCNLGRYAVDCYKRFPFHHPSIELDWHVEEPRYDYAYRAQCQSIIFRVRSTDPTIDELDIANLNIYYQSDDELTKALSEATYTANHVIIPLNLDVANLDDLPWTREILFRPTLNTRNREQWYQILFSFIMNLEKMVLFYESIYELRRPVVHSGIWMTLDRLLTIVGQ